MTNHKTIGDQDRQKLLLTLRDRFAENKTRHPDINWKDIAARLEAQPGKLWSLQQMETTGGEPDVVAIGAESDQIAFCDCSAESPSKRRSLCYDRAAWESRKKYKPNGNAVDAAAEMGIELLDEDLYTELQTFGPFDTKTSSWLKTPDGVRKLGGALFGDHRFGRTFVYHNGAESYYAARGFRGMLWI